MRSVNRRPGSRVPGLIACAALLLGASPVAAELHHLVAAEGIVEIAVASHADGGSSVAWLLQEASLENRVYLQRFDASGSPVTARALVYQDLFPASNLQVATDSAGNDLVAFRLYVGMTNATDEHLAAAYSSTGVRLWGPLGITPLSGVYRGFVSSMKIAASPGGGWLSTWSQVGYDFTFPTVRASRLDPATGVLAPFDLSDPTSEPGVGVFALASNATRVLVAWTVKTLDVAGDADTYEVVGRLLDAEGLPTTPIHTLGIAGVGPWAIYDLAAAGFGQDRFFLAWNSQIAAGSPRTIGGRQFVGDAPASAAFVIRTSETSTVGWSPLSVAVDSSGRAILGWSEPESDGAATPAKSFMYRFRTSGGPLSSLEELSALPGYRQGSIPAVSISPTSNWIAAWPRDADGSAPAGIDGLMGTIVDGCAPETQALCLTGNRFRVTASYHDHLGRDGVGYAAPLTSESGTFWFFSPESVELILKVVDACAHPDFGNFWVFASGLTDVQVHLEVVDTWTGATWERDTALGEPFPPALDTAAFDTCSATPLRAAK